MASDIQISNLEKGRTARCPSCWNSSLTLIGRIPDSAYFAGKLLNAPLHGGSLFRCGTCNLYFRWPRISKEKLDELYKAVPPDNWQYNPRNRMDWKIASSWLKNKLGTGSVLDIGCFDGGFLKNIGSGWELYGIEICDSVCKILEDKGIKNVCRNLDEIGNLSMHFDAVVAFDILEHVENPICLLKQMADITKSDGYLIISTGNSESLSWRFLGSKYWYCHIPQHISFINPEWCRKIVDLCGLKIKFIHKFSHHENKGKLKIILFEFIKNLIYRFWPRLFGRLKFGWYRLSRTSLITKLKDTPPGWVSSKDHFIVIFKKNNGTQ